MCDLQGWVTDAPRGFGSAADLGHGLPRADELHVADGVAGIGCDAGRRQRGGVGDVAVHEGSQVDLRAAAVARHDVGAQEAPFKELAGAKAIITGGASGLGFATAERVAAAGGQVTLCDVNEEQGKASAGKLGDRARFVPCDVADESAVRAAFADLALNARAEEDGWLCVTLARQR